MVNNDLPDQAPPEVSQDKTLFTQKSKRAFVDLCSGLSDEELIPAIQRTLTNDIERLKKEKTELSEYHKKFYEAEKRAAILEENV